MDTFKKPDAYKNINSHRYLTNIYPKLLPAEHLDARVYDCNYTALLEKITTESSQQSSCTCS